MRIKNFSKSVRFFKNLVFLYSEIKKNKKILEKCNILKKIWILMGERNKKVLKKCPLFKIFRALIV